MIVNFQNDKFNKQNKRNKNRVQILIKTKSEKMKLSKRQ